MARILIVYGTTEGQTAKVAQAMAEALRQRQHSVRLLKGDELPADFIPDDFDAAIVGGSVHYGQFQRYIKDFAKNHLAALNDMPSAFFAVSGAAIGQTAEERAQAAQQAAHFLDQTGWRPRQIGAFAGAVLYTRYGFLKRAMMRMISRYAGRDTDTSRDFEYTDWEAVKRFAGEFARSLETTPQRQAVGV